MTFTKKAFEKAYAIIGSSDIIKRTPLEFNPRLSIKYSANVYLKREDVQPVRSFKIRGAYYKIFNNLQYTTSPFSVTTCSAGNHAQGVAITCNTLKIPHSIFVPLSTPKQKIERIKYHGGTYIDLHITGDSLKECLYTSLKYSNDNQSMFVHPFNDIEVILGQSTVGQEIYDEIKPDYIVTAVGGGGLISGLSSYSKLIYPKCKIVSSEPMNANSMHLSLHSGTIEEVNNLDTFVDGAAVSIVGDKCFNICKDTIDRTVLIDNGHLCNDIIEAYQHDGMILEPAGALGISALEHIKTDIFGKNVVCVVTGGNNDITRYPDMVERAAQYNKIKHYFIIEFKQIPGQLINFTQNVLGDSIDITKFEYLKKTNKDTGTVLVGIELENPCQITNVLLNMKQYKYKYTKINNDHLLYSYLI